MLGGVTRHMLPHLPPPCKEAVTGGYRSSTKTTLMKIGPNEE